MSNLNSHLFSRILQNSSSMTFWGRSLVNIVSKPPSLSPTTLSPSPPTFIKESMRFLTNGCNEGEAGDGGEKSFARNEGKPGMVGGGRGGGGWMGHLLSLFSFFKLRKQHFLNEKLLLYFSLSEANFGCLRLDAFDFQLKFSLRYNNLVLKENYLFLLIYTV